MVRNDESLFWKKKEFVSFVLSILVFFIHTYFAQDTGDGSFVSVLNYKVSYFFSRSLTQFAVPMFFILSGITFFKNYNNASYTRKIRSRFFSLILPYLLWNTVWLIWELLCAYTPLAKFSAAEPYPLTVLSILKAVFFYGCYGPFWFIFNLIVFSLAAPLIFCIIRNKYIGIAAVLVLSIASLFGIGLPEAIFYYPTSIVFYLIGAILGFHFFDRVSARSSKPTQIASCVFLAAYILSKNIVPQHLHNTAPLLLIVVHTAAAFSLWNTTDLFIEKLTPRTLYRRSFAIYAMHLNISIVLSKLLTLCLPQSGWLEIPKFLLTILLTLTVISLACTILEKFFPKLYALFMGSRALKKTQTHA